MAARKTPSAGAKPDKLMRDALMLELNREDDHDGKKVKRYRKIAANLAQAASDGKEYAIKEVFDRIDGKAMQAIQGDLKGNFVVKWES